MHEWMCTYITYLCMSYIYLHNYCSTYKFLQNQPTSLQNENDEGSNAFNHKVANKKLLLNYSILKHVAVASTLISSFMLCPPWFHLNKNWSSTGPILNSDDPVRLWALLMDVPLTTKSETTVPGMVMVFFWDVHLYIMLIYIYIYICSYIYICKVFLDIYGIIWSYDHMWFHCLVEKLARTIYRIYMYLQYYDSMHSFTASVK